MTKDVAQRRRWTLYEAVNLEFPTLACLVPSPIGSGPVASTGSDS